jgi:outer membrane receptor protein involved in Fe transport
LARLLASRSLAAFLLPGLAGLPALAQPVTPAPGGEPAAAAPESTAPAVTPSAPPNTGSLPGVTVFGQKRKADLGPLPGLSIPRDQIPANVQSIGAGELRDKGSRGLTELLNTQLQSVSVADYSGNPLTRDVNFRGFTAGSQVGTPQGLSVFLDGVRVNEPFGDIVNWALLPMNAVERLDLFPGANPIFGLNTLGGALSLRTRSGFGAPGLELEVQTGSFGRRQFEGAVGLNNDADLAVFASAQLMQEDGWRDNSPSRTGLVFLRGDWQGRGAKVDASLLLANNHLVGNGLVPLDLWKSRPQSVFTSPDESVDRLAQFHLGSEIQLGGRWSLTSQAYHRRSRRAGLGADMYEGFQELIDGANSGGSITHNGNRLPQTLPLCRYLDADGDGLRDDDQPLNGPRGSGCSDMAFNQIVAAGPRNGGHVTTTGSPQPPTPGVVEGTPIGLLTRTDLAQTTQGLGTQLNGNFDTHKFMLGAALDRASAHYGMSQQLGLMDAAHQVFAAPGLIAPDFGAAYLPVTVNAFDGTQKHLGIYASDTWSLTPALTATLAGRYNRSQVQNHLLARSTTAELADIGRLNPWLLCRTDDPASCETEPAVYIPPANRGLSPTQERFSYRSFNPNVGLNWQADDNTLLFGNLSRGARVPSVIELGCAFDPTPVALLPGVPEAGTAPRSLMGPTCTLPTALSGDPFLPQIRASAGELGARGKVSGWDWNLGVFRTDLKNDLYFVGVGDGRSYFDTIGKTRRQGLELGLAGRLSGMDLKLNYSYVQASFESTFYMVSPHNSSADFDQNSRTVVSDPGLLFGQITLPGSNATANRGFGTYHMIRVDPGARLPGIPAHNLNLSASAQVLPSLKMGLTMVARSGVFLRGNENNRHQAAGTDQEIGQYFCKQDACPNGLTQMLTSAGRPFTQPGRVGGYAIVNLDARLSLSRDLTALLQVGNLFDRRYLTAGRLGVNPFSPATVGAVGPSGWNYNAAEWQNASYVGPGAPRTIFIGLRWELE